MTQVRFPFDAAEVQTISTPAVTLASAVAIENTKTILDISAVDANATLNLSIDDEVIAGSELVIKVSQGTTGGDLSLGTGFDSDAPDLTGVADDVDVIECVYDGTAFQAKGNWEKIVDAA